MTVTQRDIYASRLAVLLIVLLTVLALVLRIHCAARSCLWVDESLFLGVTHLPTIADMLAFLRLHESHPPLFYLIMRGWQAIFGPSDAAVLAPQVLLGAALVPTLYAVGCRVYNRKTGILAATLVTVSSVFINYSTQVRPYALMPLMAFLSSFLAWRLLQGQRQEASNSTSDLSKKDQRAGSKGAWSLWAAYGLCLLCLIYIHNWCLLFLASNWIVIALYLWRQVRSGKAHLASFYPWLGIHVAVILLYLPWLPDLLRQAKYAGHGGSNYLAVASERLGMLFAAIGIPNASSATSASIVVILGGAGIGLLLYIAWVLRFSLVQRKAQVSLPKEGSGNTEAAAWIFCGIPMATFLIAFALSPFNNALLLRCNLAAVPSLILFLSYPMASILGGGPLGERGGLRFWSVAALTGLLLWEGILGTKALQAVSKSEARTDAQLLTERVQPDDVVLIAPGFAAPSFNRYFTKANEQIDYPYYPYGHRQEVTPYDHTYQRESSEEAFWRARECILQARKQKRRLWFVTICLVQTERAQPKPLAFSAKVDPLLIAAERAAELYTVTTQIYGQPDPQINQPPMHKTREGFQFFLFRP